MLSLTYFEMVSITIYGDSIDLGRGWILVGGAAQFLQKTLIPRNWGSLHRFGHDVCGNWAHQKQFGVFPDLEAAIQS